MVFNSPMASCLPLPAEIGKIKMWYSQQDSWLAGLQLYDRVGTLVFESAMQIVFNCPSYHYIVTVLKEGERIVGIKSHTPEAKLAVHVSF